MSLQFKAYYKTWQGLLKRGRKFLSGLVSQKFRGLLQDGQGLFNNVKLLGKYTLFSVRNHFMRNWYKKYQNFK